MASPAPIAVARDHEHLVSLGVIKDARRRQRRRRSVVLIAVVAIAATGVVALRSSEKNGAIRGEAPRTVPAAQLLAPRSGIRVACRVPNSIACDRIGIAIFLRRPARAVSASVAGRTIKLDDPDWSGTPRNGQRSLFVGFLHHAGLRGNGPLAVRTNRGTDHWTGADPVSATIQVLVTYANGAKRTTTFRTDLGAGWG